MTIASIALAAGLLLAIGLTAAHAAEPASVAPSASTAPSASPPVGTEAGADTNGRPAIDTTERRTIEQRLDQEFTFAFDNVPVNEVVARLRVATGLTILLDPCIALEPDPQVDMLEPPPNVTFTADKMPLRAVLARIAELTGLAYAVRGRAVLIILPRPFGSGRPQGACVHLKGASPALRELLARRMKVDFDDASFGDIIQRMRLATGADIAVAPEPATRHDRLSIGSADEEPLWAVLDSLGDSLDVTFTAQGDTLRVGVAEDARSPWTDVAPAVGAPGDIPRADPTLVTF